MIKTINPANIILNEIKKKRKTLSRSPGQSPSRKIRRMDSSPLADQQPMYPVLPTHLVNKHHNQKVTENDYLMRVHENFIRMQEVSDNLKNIVVEDINVKYAKPAKNADSSYSSSSSSSSSSSHTQYAVDAVRMTNEEVQEVSEYYLNGEDGETVLGKLLSLFFNILSRLTVMFILVKENPFLVGVITYLFAILSFLTNIMFYTKVGKFILLLIFFKLYNDNNRVAVFILDSIGQLTSKTIDYSSSVGWQAAKGIFKFGLKHFGKHIIKFTSIFITKYFLSWVGSMFMLFTDNALDFLSKYFGTEISKEIVPLFKNIRDILLAIQASQENHSMQMEIIKSNMELLTEGVANISGQQQLVMGTLNSMPAAVANYQQLIEYSKYAAYAAVPAIGWGMNKYYTRRIKN